MFLLYRKTQLSISQILPASNLPTGKLRRDDALFFEMLKERRDG
jgi:hypothetical protein